MNIEFIKSALAGLVRHLLGMLGAVLVTKGLATDSDVQALVEAGVGLAGVVVAVVWSVFNKKKKIEPSA